MMNGAEWTTSDLDPTLVRAIYLTVQILGSTTRTKNFSDATALYLKP